MLIIIINDNKNNFQINNVIFLHLHFKLSSILGEIKVIFGFFVTTARSWYRYILLFYIYI